MNLFEYNRRNRDAWVAKVAADIPPGSHVLDVGAGIGPYRNLFSHCVYHAQDFGLEPATVGNYTSLQYECDIVSIPAPDESYDAVLCTEVLEHVPEPIKAVMEMGRLLKPGGLLILSAPLGSILHQEPFHFYGGYTPHWYGKVLPLAGLRLEYIDRNGGFFQLFAQEGQRFSALIDPRRTAGTSWKRVPLTLLWLATLPFLRLLLPLVAASLDALELEAISTAGYHVVGRKTPSSSSPRLEDR